MRIFNFTVFLIALSVLVSSVPAEATVITFDSLDTSAGAVVVTNQFAGLGVTFSGLAVIDGGSFHTSAPNVGSINNVAPSTLTVTANFAADVTSVSAVFFDTEVGSTLVTMEAFDASNSSLGSTTVVTTPDSADPTIGTLVGLSAIGAIRKITMSTDPDGSLFDDFTFTPDIAVPVPEPATLSLFGLGLGLIGLGAARRRKRAA